MRERRDWRWHRQGWRRHLVFGCCAAFVARVLLQMLLFWHRKITWVEVLAEAGGRERREPRNSKGELGKQSTAMLATRNRAPVLR